MIKGKNKFQKVMKNYSKFSIPGKPASGDVDKMIK